MTARNVIPLLWPRKEIVGLARDGVIREQPDARRQVVGQLSGPRPVDRQAAVEQVNLSSRKRNFWDKR